MRMKMAFSIRTTVVLLFLIFMSPFAKCEVQCPPSQEILSCSCFVLDDQLHVQCSGPDVPILQHSLQVLNGPVKSFSVYDLDARASILPNGVTDNVTSPVYHLQVRKLILTLTYFLRLYVNGREMCRNPKIKAIILRLMHNITLHLLYNKTRK
jgi:hypothetical protein